MVWIIASIIAATILFIVFKLFDNNKVDRFSAVVFNYLFAGTTGLLFFDVSVNGYLECSSCLIFAFALGAVFITLFNLIAFVTAKNGAAVSVLANKMAFVIPVVLSVVLFQEHINSWIVSAIIAGIIGLYLSIKPEKSFNKNNKLLIWPIVLFIGSGILDFLLKVGERFVLQTWSSPMLTVAIFTSAFIFGTGFGLIRNKLVVSRKSILWGAFLGIPNFFSIFFLFEAIKAFSANSAIIFPINNVGIISCTALVAVLFFKERLSKINLLGLLLCLVSIVILSSEA